MLKLEQKVIRKMANAGLISAAYYTVGEQYKHQHFDLVDELADDGFPRFATVRCEKAVNGLGSRPLHPAFDTLVFGYVSGCFHPVLLDVAKEPLDSKHIKRGEETHPRYAAFM